MKLSTVVAVVAVVVGSVSCGTRSVDELARPVQVEPAESQLADDLAERVPERREEDVLGRMGSVSETSEALLEPLFGALLTHAEVDAYFPDLPEVDWNSGFSDRLLPSYPASCINQDLEEITCRDAHLRVLPCSDGALRPAAGVTRFTGTHSTRVGVRQYLAVFDTPVEADAYAGLFEESFDDRRCWAWGGFEDPSWSQFPVDSWRTTWTDDRGVWRVRVEIPLAVSDEALRGWQEDVASFPNGGTLDGATVFRSADAWVHVVDNVLLYSVASELLLQRLDRAELERMVIDTEDLLRFAVESS